MRHARRLLIGPLLLVLVAMALLGCSNRPNLDNVGSTLPPAAPVKVVDPDKVIAGLKAALGPDSPVRVKATADARIQGARMAVIIEGDFQGNEMDAHLSFRDGAVQLSFDVIAADGKAYVRPYKGKWAKSPEKVPPKGSGPFGDMDKADLQFKGPSKKDRDLYTIVWSEVPSATRALDGTVFTNIRIKTSLMNFEVDANGKPYTATYALKGTAKINGKNRAMTINGFYQFFAIRETLEFESPMK